jgi:hypothetical protein
VFLELVGLNGVWRQLVTFIAVALVAGVEVISDASTLIAGEIGQKIGGLKPYWKP